MQRENFSQLIHNIDLRRLETNFIFSINIFKYITAEPAQETDIKLHKVLMIPDVIIWEEIAVRILFELTPVTQKESQVVYNKMYSQFKGNY